MRQILVSILFLLAISCQSQHKSGDLHMRVFNDYGDSFCGKTLVHLTLTRESLDLISTEAELRLDIIAKNIDEHGSYRCQDQDGNLYKVIPLENDTGGTGIEFRPDNSLLNTVRIANQQLCEE